MQKCPKSEKNYCQCQSSVGQVYSRIRRLVVVRL